MKAIIKVSALAHALDITQKLAAPGEDGVVAISYDGTKKLTIRSASDTSQSVVRVQFDSIEGEAVEFGIVLASLRDATKGHTTISMTVANAVVTLKAKGSVITLPTVDTPDIEGVSKAEEEQEWELSAETAATLLGAVKAVALKPTTMLTSWIPIGIRLRKNSGFVCSYDDNRVSWGTIKEGGDFECVAPTDTMVAVLDALKGHSLRVATSKGRLAVTTKTAQVIINTPVDDTLSSLDEVIEKSREMAKQKGQIGALDRGTLQRFFDNARAITGKDRAEIVSNGKTLSIQSTIGAVTHDMPAPEFKVDFEFFAEAVGKVQGSSVNLNVVGSDFLSIGSSVGAIVIGQNQ